MTATAVLASGSPVVDGLPLAAFLCNSAERSIVNGLRETAQHCVANALHVRFYVLDSPDDQREVVLSPARGIIWDGHGGWVRDAPAVDGIPLNDVLSASGRKIRADVLMIGCCWGGSDDFTDVVRRHLSAPLVYIGCEERAGKTHGGKVQRCLESQSPGTCGQLTGYAVGEPGRVRAKLEAG
jgi:hypothetical protein